ncbi:M-phase inducer phosphatase-like [Ptychodera flava]|uniref:M-phase inducer phosphatase-like n=1 Tax=Ptychodera flava TaxID=63121 RepID=UPI00396A18D6
MTAESTRRNSLGLPLLGGHEMFSPSAFVGTTVLSPMTDLAMNLSGLSTSFGATPKRRLSLSNTGTPTPDRPSSLSSDAGCCLDSPSPLESPSPLFGQPFTFTAIHQPQRDNVCESEHNENSNGSSSSGTYSDSETSNDGENFSNIKDRKKLIIRRPSTFRRNNSVPARLHRLSKIHSLPKSEINRLETDYSGKQSPEAPHPVVNVQATFFIGETQDKENITQESTALPKSKNDDFNFVAPLPPRRPLGNGNFTSSGYTPPKKRPISAPACLLNQDSPVYLSRSKLTSTEEEDDDGFLELIDDDNDIQENKSRNIPDMSGLLSGTLLHKGFSPIGPSNAGQDSTDGPSELLMVPSNFDFSFTDKYAEFSQSQVKQTSEPKYDDTPSAGTRTKRGLFRSPSVPGNDSKNVDKSYFLKRPDRPCDSSSPIKSKRRCSVASPLCLSSQTSKVGRPGLFRSKSVIATDHIDRALMVGGDQENLIGDFSESFALPLVKGKHQDLKSISPATMRRLLNNEFDSVEYTIVDCRYPYEHKGGHIMGAKNIYTKGEILEEFLGKEKLRSLSKSKKKHIIVFHCEFSSERAPNLNRFLRNKDRDLNKDNYPALHYPELYLLEGGYKAFFQSCKDLCEPQTYMQMLDKDHANAYKHFRMKSKSWAGERSRMGFAARFKNL